MSEGAAEGSGPVDLGLLRTFLAVHRTGSFTSAARVLGLAQPTVTGQVRALEDHLGRQLFERLPRGAAATAVADELAAEVAGPLDALAAVAERGTGREGDEPVRLAGPAELLGERVLPELAPLVADGLRLRVTTGLADELLEGLRAGRFDLVVSAIRPRGRTIAATALADEEFVLVAGPAWAERLGELTAGELTPGELGALAEVPLLTYAEDLPIARRYWRHVFGRRLNTPAAVVMPDLRAQAGAVAAGAGIAVLPRYLCAGALASGDLIALLDPPDPPINTLFLAERAGTSQSPHLTRVRDRLLRAARAW
ncbi:LysR family transcriptional regulator [Saccharopolyspora sp. ID03-671]|uniref:LysR family transcriptional regulator n=1 Tax=Saccharopolyspora sp. ID03-671 TaxID=3073066 RepID=UPI00324A782C